MRHKLAKLTECFSGPYQFVTRFFCSKPLATLSRGTQQYGACPADDASHSENVDLLSRIDKRWGDIIKVLGPTITLNPVTSLEINMLTQCQSVLRNEIDVETFMKLKISYENDPNYKKLEAGKCGFFTMSKNKTVELMSEVSQHVQKNQKLQTAKNTL